MVLGYIEKDWGISFPKSYIWCQGNTFRNSSSSFMLSIANIPFKFLNFRGMICDLIVGNKEYKFTTYNNAKILQYNVNRENINITLKKGKYILNIKSNNNTGNKLIAPVKGNMNKNILESITSNVYISLTKDGNIIFSDMSSNCGLEIV